MIHSIFEFSDTVVREIMRPRIDIIAAPEYAPIGDVIDLISEHHVSRLPVYQGSLDHVVGLLYAKDLLPRQIRGEMDVPVREVMRPAIFVPETKHISELFHEMRVQKQTLVIVIDEYGGTAGLVTMEDLLEEIVGEIYDEYDVVQPAIEWLDDRTVLVEGTVTMSELDELFDHAFPEGEYDTVSGFIYTHFGDVPTPGESFLEDGYTFIVDKLSGHRIKKVRIHLPDPSERANGNHAS